MIRWQSRGQSCIKPSIRSSEKSLGALSLSAQGQRIVMTFSLPEFRRKWSCRGNMSAGSAMVTVALALSLAVSLALAERAEARKYPAPLDLFGLGTPRPRGTVHSARIPLPKPRPEEAPKATDKAE